MFTDVVMLDNTSMHPSIGDTEGLRKILEINALLDVARIKIQEETCHEEAQGQSQADPVAAEPSEGGSSL